MSPQYVLALGLTATAGILFAAQRRLLKRRPPLDPHYTPVGPVTVTCGDSTTGSDATGAANAGGSVLSRAKTSPVAGFVLLSL